MTKRIRPGKPPVSICINVAMRDAQSANGGKLELWMLRGGSQDKPEPLGAWLARLIEGLCRQQECARADLQLDHNPPLRLRAYNAKDADRAAFLRAGNTITARQYWERIAACYSPHAHSEDHLFYRGDHRIKTNVRGDNGQFSDRVLIKRERRRERKKTPKKPWHKGGKSRYRAIPKRRHAWPKRKLGGNRWLPRRSPN